MRQSTLVIAWYDLKRVLVEREMLFWIFLGPLIFTLFFGFLFRPQEPKRPQLAVVDLGTSQAVSSQIIPLLEEDGIQVRKTTRQDPRGLTLILPGDTEAALRTGKKVQLILHAGAEENSVERDLRFKIHKALTRYYFSIHGSSGSSAADLPEGPLSIREEDLGIRARGQTSGFQRSVPAYLVMFVFLNLLVSGALIAEDRASGRLRRIAMAPVSRYEILLGKLLGRFFVGWIQILWMLLLGWILRIRWAEHLGTFVIFLSLFALASASLGILMGTLFKDPDKCASAAVWVAILLSPLGGLWWPLEIVGPTMRQLAYLVPTGWAMEGINNMLAFGAGPLEVAPFAGEFLLLFAASLFLASRRLQC